MPIGGEFPCRVADKMLDGDVAVTEFELHLLFYVPFWYNPLRKGMNPLIITAVLLQEWF